MNKKQKIISGIIVSGLSCTTVSACYWQSNRYLQAKRRWQKMGEQQREGKLENLDLSNLPDFEDENEIYDWEYMLVKVKGKLDKFNTFIWRFHEGQYGYQVLNTLKDKQDQGLIINLGWVPSTKKNQYLEIDTDQTSQDIQIVSMVKKAELEDYLNQSKNQLQQLDNHQSYIDLNDLLKQYNIKNGNNKIFLEHFNFYQEDNLHDPSFKADQIIFKQKNNQKQDDNILDDYDKEMYPIVPNINTYQQPYLTPNKHLEYASFWGVCSFVGIISLIKIIRI